MLILGWLNESTIRIGITIVNGIYHVAAWAFELFLVLACGELISTDKYQVLIENFYIVIGIVMLFFLSFVLLKGMVDPDNKKEGSSTVQKVIVNLVVSTLILAVLPTVITFLYDFQKSVIMNYNSIGKFFGPGFSDDSLQEDSPVKNMNVVRSGAYHIVNGVYTAFLTVNPEECDPPINDNNTTASAIEACQNTTYADKWKFQKNFIVSEYCDTSKLSFRCATAIADKYGRFGIYKNFADNIDEGEMEHNFLISLISAGILAYIGISFAIDMALRLVKLAFYQIIAPIPIFARVIPDTKLSKSFNNWLKAILTCYLEVFVRVFILYFTVFLCTKMLEKDSFLSRDVYSFGSASLAFFARAFAIMGVILFMKQAPKLLAEVTGLDSANMKLGLKDKLKDAGLFTAAGALGAGVTALSRKGVEQFKNTRNKFKGIKGTHGKAKAKAIAGAVWSIPSGFVKTKVATKSATIRGAIAGSKASSFADSKKAATKGVKDAFDATVKRNKYMAAHSSGKGFFDDAAQTLLGHGKDAVSSVATWSGVNSKKTIATLKEENAAMESIKSSRDAFNTEIDNLIQSTISSGKNIIDTGRREINLEEIREAINNFNRASVLGKIDIPDGKGGTKPLTKIEAETIYKNLMKNARYLVQDDLMVADTTWDNYDPSVKAKLSQGRVKAITYKGNIRNNANLDALVEANVHGADFSDNKDYVMSQVKTSDFSYNNVNYKQVSYDHINNVLSYFDGNQYQKRVLSSTNDQSLIDEILKNSTISDNRTIGNMHQALKRNIGNNTVEITQRDHQKPDDNKK